MNRKIRVCFVAPAGYPVLAGDRTIEYVGGAEVQQAFIGTELARRGHDVSMISMDFGQHESERVQGVRVLKMHAPDAGLPVLRFVHPRFTSVWAAMQRADADVYYQRAGGALTGFVSAFCRRNSRLSVFAGAHDADFDPALPLIGLARDRAICRWGIRSAGQVIVQTRRQADECRRVYGREAVQINSCYGHVGRPGRHDGVVLWVATFKPHKRPERFIDLARALPQYRFKLVGGPSGADRGYHERLMREAADLPNIEFMGFVPYADVEQCFDGASVFVNTSEGEGFPNTFLQSWSRGIPTVSFFDPGAEHSGRPVAKVVGNPAEMAHAVRQLKENPDAWRESGARAMRFFEANHGLRRIVDRYEATLEAALRTAAGRTSSRITI